MHNDIIEFIRRRDYRFVRDLGQGACGRTVLLYDDQIDESFVCKKFAPCSEDTRQELFFNFVRETKILHRVYHENVVRVFNCYLYPEDFTGYILMEFVEGSDIEDYLAKSPERINELFLQAIAGFRYLESKSILHRDIRPQNLMVRADGIVKIIDFGFGKLVRESKDFDKSISLNWWCELPREFSDGIYDFKTEVYFVGKLFEGIIQDNSIDHFKYPRMLANMCQRDPDNRVRGFAEIEKAIQDDRFYEIGFAEEEMAIYRTFADSLAAHVTKIESEAKYQDDVDRVQMGLENVYRSVMLEDTVPDSGAVLRCLLNGGFYYTKAGLPVQAVKEFVRLLKSSSPEKKRIILLNVHTRLDAVSRYDDQTSYEDNLPF